MNSLLAPCSSGLTCFIVKKYIVPDVKAGELCRDDSMPGQLGALTNGMMAGLIGVTAGADSMSSYACLVLGGCSGLIYCVACRWMLKWRVDDPLEAF